MFISNITKYIKGLIYILIGVAVATIIIVFSKSLPENDFVEMIADIAEMSLFIILILQLIPTILRSYGCVYNDNGPNQFLSNLVYVIKNNHIALGCLFIALCILHIGTNCLYESIEWDMETITGILTIAFLIPAVILSILRINNSEKYRKPHRFFLLLTYLAFIFHLVD